MHHCRIEAGALVAWVSPLGGGLVDLSRLTGATPETLLERSPPEIDDPAWLAGRLRLDGIAGADDAVWRILDRTPLSARLRLDTESGPITIRYELTPDALLVELDVMFGEPQPLAGAYLLRRPGPGLEISPVRGFGSPGMADGVTTLPINELASTAHAFAFTLRPGADA
ncbi:MAG: hypothetical protein H6810_04580 [Phycisphaeraceae bacterium]|nr:MAG: hypothetical protein H6810_04580 [Phycisphaeraceae bacterium]